jgi:ectoine hydroxylase
MNKVSDIKSDANADLYPTRLATGEVWRDRVDPVIWGDKTPTDHLTRDDLDRYERDGYLVKHDLFADDEVSALLDAAQDLRNSAPERLGPNAIREPGSGDLRTLFQLETHHDLFDRLSRSERVAGIARRILNDEVYLHQSRLNYKPGFTGKEFYWHSDFETWHAEDGLPRMRALSASVLLTDNDALNGPLMLMPGSQMHYVGCQGETPENNHETSLKKQEIGTPSPEALDWMAKKFGIDYAAGKAGTVIFFDCNTIHGSNGNITPFPRSNAFFVFNALSNQPRDPFAADDPRPEYLGNRSEIAALRIEDAPLT